MTLAWSGKRSGDLIGDGATRILHQRRAGTPPAMARRVGLGHLVCGQKLEHRSIMAPHNPRMLAIKAKATH